MTKLIDLTEKGERLFSFLGPKGTLEGKIIVPNETKPYIAIIGHPHSLQGGTMENKVVTTAARACKDLGITSIRFNFRGVGNSSGTFDNGVGESEDMIMLANYCLQNFKSYKLLFIGFSFGSYVAYQSAMKVENALLITIAPPTPRYDYKKTTKSPWVIIQGTNDEVVDYEDVASFATNESRGLELITFANTGHFFHGKLIELRESIKNIILKQVINHEPS